jgi:ribosome-associated toxin RatA of RatAB toxin-antitoxin module
MAEKTEGTVEIDATPKEIMAVIGDFDAYPDWADVKSAEVVKKDKQGRAKEVVLSVSQMGLSDNLHLAYTYKAADKGISWTLVKATNVKTLDGSYDLEGGKGGTKVIYRLAMEPSIPLPGMVKRQIEKRITKNALDGLKKRVERG